MEVLESGQERTEKFNVDDTMKKTVGHRSSRMDIGEEVVRLRIHAKLSLPTAPGVASASPAPSASATEGSDQKTSTHKVEVARAKRSVRIASTFELWPLQYWQIGTKHSSMSEVGTEERACQAAVTRAYLRGARR